MINVRLFEAKNIFKKPDSEEPPRICSLLLESSKERLSTGEFSQQINQTLSFQMVDTSSDILYVEIKTTEKELIASGKIDITDAFSGFPMNQWFDLESKTELDGTPKIHLEIETFFIDENDTGGSEEEESQSDSVSYNQPQQFDSDSFSGFSNIAQSTSRPSFEPVKPIEVPEYEYYYVEEEEDFVDEGDANQDEPSAQMPSSQKVNTGSLSVNVDPTSIPTSKKIAAPSSLQKRRVQKMHSSDKMPQSLSSLPKKSQLPTTDVTIAEKSNPQSDDATPDTEINDKKTDEESKQNNLEKEEETKQSSDEQTESKNQDQKEIEEKQEEIEKENKQESSDETQQQEFPDIPKEKVIKPRRRSKVEELYDRTKTNDNSRKKSQEFYKLELSTSGEQLISKDKQSQENENSSNSSQKEHLKKPEKLSVFSASSSEDLTHTPQKKHDKQEKNHLSTGSESSEEPKSNRIKVVSRKRSPESSCPNSLKEIPKEEEKQQNQKHEKKEEKAQTQETKEVKDKPSKRVKIQELPKSSKEIPQNQVNKEEEEKTNKQKKTEKKQGKKKVVKQPKEEIEATNKTSEQNDVITTKSNYKSKSSLYQPHKVVLTKKDIINKEKTITLKKKRLKRIKMQIAEEAQYVDKQLQSMNMDVKRETNLTEMKVLLERNSSLIAQAEKEIKQNNEFSPLTKARIQKALEETTTSLGSI